jgi:uncharacterized membrane protein YhaH (DUF805 family)
LILWLNQWHLKQKWEENMGFIEAIKSFYGRYTDFKTRSSRSEFWWVMLYQAIVAIILMVPIMGGLMAVMADMGPDVNPMQMYGAMFSGPFGIILGLFILVNIIPGIALGVRRIHDFDKSGWLYLIVLFGGFIPLVGMLVSLGWIIINFFRGTVGSNRFGDDPLG